MNKHSFPTPFRTPHLPYKANATPDDQFATHQEVVSLFVRPSHIEEKVDGSFIMTALDEEHFIVRNKKHTLNKAFLGKTAAKNQYRSIHNYVVDHRKRWEKLSESFVRTPVVLGEWMHMTHGIKYDQLPDKYIAFDIWDGEKYVEFTKSRSLLKAAGFTVPPLVFEGVIPDYAFLEMLCQGESPWVGNGDRRREGLYVRQDDARYKIVREDFERGKYLGKEIIENRVLKFKK
jgi:hypothetical protein